MQKIALQFKCNLENLTDLQAEGEDFRWYLKVYESFSCTLTTRKKNGMSEIYGDNQWQSQPDYFVMLGSADKSL